MTWSLDHGYKTECIQACLVYLIKQAMIWRCMPQYWGHALLITLHSFRQIVITIPCPWEHFGSHARNWTDIAHSLKLSTSVMIILKLHHSMISHAYRLGNHNTQLLRRFLINILQCNKKRDGNNVFIYVSVNTKGRAIEKLLSPNLTNIVTL